MVSMLASSAVDRGFKLRSGETKGYKIGILYAGLINRKCTAKRNKIKDKQYKLLLNRGGC